MISRPEMIELCKELGIDYQGLSLKDLNRKLRHVTTKRFIQDTKVPADNLPENLKKYLTEQRGFRIKDKYGNDYNYKGELL